MKYKCTKCSRAIEIDEELCLPCSKEDVVSSLAELIEQNPEFEVYADNCESLSSNPVSHV